MIFKRMEVFGFKSFADKLDIDFNNGITAIVGPNGCGKSNIADAIRWVLGEQSSKTLRGTSMQDVIFNGTEKRKSLSYCEVNLVFDNTFKHFNIEYDEVVIGRKLFRSGDSEYSINRKECRLKDITNLLHDSGIGRDGYSIIGQGKVEEIISSKPEDRRTIFEGAAGIAKFKSRKVEAERRLERTEENISRINDVIHEIERTLGPLLKQAENAKKFLQYKEQLKSLEVNAYIYGYDTASAQKGEIDARISELNEAISVKQKQIADTIKQNNKCLDDITNMDKKIEKARDTILTLSLGLEKHAGEAKLVVEKLNFFNIEADRLKGDIEQINATIAAEAAQLEKEKERIKILITQKGELSRLSEITGNDYLKVIDELTATEGISEDGSPSENLIAAQRNYNNLASALSAEQARARTFENIINSGEGFKFAVKKINEIKEQNGSLAKQIIGVVAKLIEVPVKYAVAIETALGNSAQNIITANENDAKALIDHLKQKSYGRATFLPLTAAKPRSMDQRVILSGVRNLKIASDVIKYPKQIENAILNLLGGVAIVDTLDDAIKLAKDSNYGCKIVSLEGDVIEPRGSITGGSRGAEQSSVWAVSHLEASKAKIMQLEAEVKVAKECLDESERVRKSAFIRLKDQRDLHHNEMTNLKVRIAQTDGEILICNNNIKRLTDNAENNDRILTERTNELAKVNKNINIAESLQLSEKDSKLYKDGTEKLESAKKGLAELDDYKNNLHKTLAKLEEDRNAFSTQSTALSEKLFKEEVAKAKIDTDIEFLEKRVFEEYGLNYSSAYEYKKDDFDYKKSGKQIDDLRKEIAKLGNVNVNAIEDSKDQQIRYDEYKTQIEDLSKAETDLKQIIKELSTEMEARFKEEFAKISQNFAIVFKELFGGGNAKLLLTEPDDIINSGIEIVAQPPGKKLQSLSLLSGGEKALTAIAILFAILKLKPIPFCLLDEIEAALDETNVFRFASYLQKFAENSQFIVITHRKPTMELAHSLYGVTMEEKGVSKMVSVKLSEAV